MQMQPVGDRCRHRPVAAIFVVPQNGVTDMRHMGPQLMLPSGMGHEHQEGESLPRMVGRPVKSDGALGALLSAGVPHAVAFWASLFQKRHVDRALARMRHALDHRPIFLLHLAGGEQAPQCRRHVAPARHHQNARGVAVEPVHQPRPLAKLGGPGFEKPVNMPRHAGAALDGETGGLVQHQDVVVAVEDHCLEQRPVLRRERLGGGRRIARSGRKGERRQAHFLAGAQARIALDPRSVKPHLAGPQQLVEIGIGQPRETQAAPAVEPHAFLLGLDRMEGGRRHGALNPALEALVELM